MPVSNEDRAIYAKLSDTDRASAVQAQLKLIREGSTGPGMMDHVAINNALDQIEVLTQKAPESVVPETDKPKTKADLAKEKVDA